ncbi:hypothetical protein CTI12_AA072240 [Artemisia annua]|uniref:Uncharacterized protein n=1 Tax=Artemisia annua TaxID=35608 RepID=A0A2U1Q5Z0_ARTAN|nr:hypothetical protein CTI12_AA072240 [Artemisia annua]
MAYSTLIHPYSSPLPTLYKAQVLLKSVPQLGLSSFSTWNGLKSNGFSVSLKSLKFEKMRKNGRKGVFASLFGVGAPEALVIGVVALLVFGPKGLAEIAKNLGKTLRTFQPTIRELQEVSREFKSTLEKEIGLDDLKNPSQFNTATIPNLSSTPLSVATPEKTLAIPMETATAATTEVPQATTTPLASTNDDSLPAIPAAISEDSLAAATTPADTTTIDPSSVQEVAVSSEVGTVV